MAWTELTKERADICGVHADIIQNFYTTQTAH